jgi:hypothetical protein
VVLGEARRSTLALASLARGAVDRFGHAAPTDDTNAAATNSGSGGARRAVWVAGMRARGLTVNVATGSTHARFGLRSN